MPLLLILLAVAVFAYLYWRRRTTTLTRDCRWREDRPRGMWRCAYCGAEVRSVAQPENCLRAR